MASARQILRNTREEVPGLINEFSITDGHSDLWLMWRDADSTRWINFGKYYFANKTTIKKIPEAGLWVGDDAVVWLCNDYNMYNHIVDMNEISS